MKYKVQSNEGVVLAIAAVGLVLTAAWAVNIYKLTAMCCEISGMLVARVIGVFVPPVGMILGFL